MEWIYKNIVITIQQDGFFHFKINEKDYIVPSLYEANLKIDGLLIDYYNFNKQDIDKMFKKLDKREKDFVNSLIEELNRHRFNACCGIGLSEDMLFNFD